MEVSETMIIVTGAASGFGRSMALHFSENKAKVIAVDKDLAALEMVKTENQDIQICLCDLTNNTQVEEMMEDLFGEHPEMNILINNAGIMKNAPLVNLLQRPDNRHPIDLWHAVIEINQHAVFYTTRSFVSNMIKHRNKGVVINISSIAARGNIGQTAYSASKAAVEAMTKVWAKELGAYGIRTVAIAPGFIDTSGTRDALEEKMLSKWIEQTPLKRTGKIKEVVSAVQFAIENDFVNGEIINVNGGLTL